MDDRPATHVQHRVGHGGAFIDQHIGEFSPGKAKIAALYLNSDYGKVATAEQNGMNQSAKYLFMPNLCVASSLVGKEAVGGDARPRTAGGWSTPVARTSTTPLRKMTPSSPGPAGSCQKQVWETQGNAIDLSGEAAPCAWDSATSLCGK
jgi:hypothetical protein